MEALNVVVDEGLVENAYEMGNLFRAKLNDYIKSQRSSKW